MIPILFHFLSLTPKEHQYFTNKWREAFAYGKTDYRYLDIDELLEKARIIYKDYPELLKAVEMELGIGG